MLELCTDKTVFVDIFNDKGELGLVVFADDEFTFYFDHPDIVIQQAHEFIARAKNVVCFDMRHFISAGLKLPEDKVMYDVRLIYGYPDSVFELATRELGSEASELGDQERRLKANVRACRLARVDTTKHPIRALIPNSLLRRVVRLRAVATMALYYKALRSHSAAVTQYEQNGYNFARALYNIELNGIHVNVDYVKEQLKLNHPKHIASYFRSLEETEVDGFVYTKFNPIGGKTGRIKVDRGFNCLGIPHGEPREALNSRFDGGKIYSFDFNAIDYRCIIASVEDRDFARLYEDCEDFHHRTTSFFFDDVSDVRRKVMKECTYVIAYGGTIETVSQKTGLSPSKSADVMRELNEKLSPVTKFREDLYRKAIADGFVQTPHGQKVQVSQEDHPGKVLGLYAQRYSSYVFMKAFVAAEKILHQLKSKLIFTVHDELVVDMHPDEFSFVQKIKEAMENAVGGINLSVGVNSGDDYEQASK